MQQRQELIALFRTGRFTVTELAASFHVSRKTAHKWLARFAAEGDAGLLERSRAPACHPNATPPPVVDALLRLKAQHPTWGPAKLHAPEDAPSEVAAHWPKLSTRGAILARHGLVRPPRRRRHTPPWTAPFQTCTRPNDVWCADFKGWFRTQDGTRCDPLTLTDAYSRMLLRCTIATRPDYDHVRPIQESAFREYGLPLALRTDNGTPFASTGAGGLSRLAVWWVRLGIVPERIAPGHPEQNGRHERGHRTLKQETLSPPAATPQAQQERFDRFRVEFNTLRPHQALGQVPPQRRYVPSSRAYPERLPEVEYPPDAVRRRVRSNGEIKWGGELVFVSEALVDEWVGVREVEAGWRVHFGPVTLGLLRPGVRRLERLPVTRERDSTAASVTDVLS